MRPLTTQELVALADERDGPCVSINLPTHGPGGEQQDPIRLRNLLREAEHRLAGRLRHSRTRICSPWACSWPPTPPSAEAAAGGLAVPGRRRPPPAAAALPPARAGRGRRPLPCQAPAAPAVGMAGSTCWRSASAGCGCSRATGTACASWSCTTSPPGWPRRCGWRTARSSSSYTRPARRGPAAGRRRVFHGHGVGADDAKDRILRFFRDVDHGVQRALGNGRAPLGLAAVDYLRPLYRAASSYPQILEQGLSGNPDHLGAHDLHRRAWTLVGHRFRSDQQAVAVRCRALERRGRATSDLRRIVPAAVGGRVESLLVPMGAEQWGSVDPATGAAQLHRRWRPGDVDLLDLAAVETLRHGGAAYPLPAGEARPAAVLRY